MKKNETVRQFSFSDGTLKQVADQAISFARRDSVQFFQRGYSAARFTALEQQSADFGSIASDEEMVALQMLRTETKDEKRDILEEDLRTIISMAMNAFGAKSIQMRRFGDANLSKQTDNDLIRTSRIFFKTATEYQTNLAAEGLTPAFLAIIDTHIKAFDHAIDFQQLAISDREIAKEVRIEAANALYNELLKITNTGKSIFRTINEAKYNDYLIYETPSGKKEGSVVPTP